MVFVHVRHGVGLRGDERAGVGHIREKIARLEIDDAAEAGDEMKAGRLDALPLRTMRAPSSGSPARRSSSISDTRASARIFFVCAASRDTRMSGAPSAALATLTSEQKGAPVSAISVASAPCAEQPGEAGSVEFVVRGHL